MNLIDFTKEFPNEESCERKLKEYRVREGAVCPKCGCVHHYWKKDKKCFECKQCHYRQSLTANTVMHGSQLPLLYWFTAIHLLTSTKKSFSASELQRQLGHKNYMPIWAMLHKLRIAMGKRDERYTLKNMVELDEGFFTTEVPEDEKGKPLKKGRGSQRKTKVLVMAETVEGNPMEKNHKHTAVRYITMIVIDDLDVYHDICPAYIQNYLSEFCWKFNRRTMADGMFDRLVVAGLGYKNTFRYNI